MKSCQICQENGKTPAVAPLNPWEWPARLWSRLHVEFAGLFMGEMFLVLVDAHSKWLEVVVVSSNFFPTGHHSTDVSTHGLPEMLVSDNGSAFTSIRFQTFVEKHGIQHVRSAPYHSSSNGQAERVVQTFKEAIQKTTGDVQTRLARFLFQYRLTPHSSTGLSPAEMLQGRCPRSHLDLIHPDTSVKVTRSQERQKSPHYLHAKTSQVQGWGMPGILRAHVFGVESWSGWLQVHIHSD